MSSDIGIIIKKCSSKEFRVYQYCASVDYKRTEDMTLIGTFTDLEEALVFGTGRGTEYGVGYSDGVVIDERPRNTVVVYFNDGHQEVKRDVFTVRLGMHVGIEWVDDDGYVVKGPGGKAGLKEEGE